jgi:hypothetical protein
MSGHHVKVGTMGSSIKIYDTYLKFCFSMEVYGYLLRDYKPVNPYHAIRMRDLIFFFNQLHNHVNGFRSLRLYRIKDLNCNSALTSIALLVFCLVAFTFANMIYHDTALSSSVAAIVLILLFTCLILCKNFPIPFQKTKKTRSD